MKALLIATLAILSAPLANAETISCGGQRSDGVKIELNITSNESGTIAYVDPIYGRIGTQNFEKKLLRDIVGDQTVYVRAEDPSAKLFQVATATDANGKHLGKLLTREKDLPITCEISGPPVPEVQKPAPIVCKPKKYEPLMFASIAHNDLDGLKEAVTCGANVNAKNGRGCTALLAAADFECGKYRAQKILGDKNGRWLSGAQLPGNKNDSFQNLREAIDLLVSKGALLDSKDPKNGETPLIKIVRNSEDDQDSLISFIQNEPDMDAVDNEGNTALMWATTLSTTSGEAWSTVAELTAANANRALTNKDHKTAFQIAQRLGMDEADESFEHEFDKRILGELRPASKSFAVSGNNGTCAPLNFDASVGEAVEFILDAKDRMYLLKASGVPLNVMAMSGDKARQVLTLNQKGQFTLSCGIHGADQQSTGTLTVR